MGRRQIDLKLLHVRTGGGIKMKLFPAFADNFVGAGRRDRQVPQVKERGAVAGLQQQNHILFWVVVINRLQDVAGDVVMGQNHRVGHG